MRQKAQDSIGKIYNYFKVIDVESRKNTKGHISFWAKCECKCGTLKWVRLAGLKQGTTKSCGCYATALKKSKTGTKSAQYLHGHWVNKKASDTLKTWSSMIVRCNNKNSSSYKNYGEKGIKVCEKWLIFQNFLNDMGERPKGTTIDRIDNNKNYEPNNCRWATKKEQAINRKTTRFYTINGQTKCLKDWAREYNIKYLVVFKRLKRGWDLKTSLETPLKNLI